MHKLFIFVSVFVRHTVEHKPDLSNYLVSVVQQSDWMLMIYGILSVFASVNL